MKIGYRTIKTAIGVPIAIMLTQFFGVSHFVSAGILTILCIQPSRKLSVLSAWDRFIACLLALIFSFLFFEFIGYNPLAIGFLLVFFIPVTVYLNINQGLVTSIVIILNIYAEKSLSLSFILDQLIIICVGVGVGLLLNLYMPNLEKRLEDLKSQLEYNFKIILREIALYIRDDQAEWDKRELAECERILERAAILGDIDKENHLLREEHPYADYFSMRERQFELLKSMLLLVNDLPKQTVISEDIADFFDRLSVMVHPTRTSSVYLEELQTLKQAIHKGELPATYDEFATRANLFRLLHEIEEYILLKIRFMQKSAKNEKKRLKKTGAV